MNGISIKALTRKELAQYIVDEFNEYIPKKGRVVEVIVSESLEATIILDNGNKHTFYGLFANMLKTAEDK